MRLRNKVAIITGAGAGIGEATAILFAREGASVVVADINDSTFNATVKKIRESGGKAIGVHVDVSKSADVQAMVQTSLKEFGKIHILFNNAGTAASGDLMEITEEAWDRTMNVNLKGMLYGCRYAIPEMIKAGGGSIINSASMWTLVGGAISCVYPVSKAGVVGLSKYVAFRYAPQKIRVNWIIPGHIQTDLIKRRLQDPRQKEELIKKYPIGRLGEPADVAFSVLFLASDESSFITGTGLVIDGGYTLQ